MEDPKQLLAQATERHRDGRLAEAEALYLRVLQGKPDQFEAGQLLGMLRLQQGRCGDALAPVEAALKAKPDAAGTLMLHAAILHELKRPEEALKSLVKAALIQPDHADTHHLQGNILFELGRPAEALASYDRALALSPQHAGALNGRGMALHALHRFEEALASYDATLRLESKNPDLLFNHGGAAQQLGRHEEALQSFERALAVKPDDREALCARGASLHAVNRWRESIASYQRALALAGDNPTARFAVCMAQLPILYTDEPEIAERRAAYAQQLESLAAEVGRMTRPGRCAEAVGLRQPFFLAYQGRNDRELQAVYGGLVCRIMADRYPCPALPPPPTAGEPVRIGIVSGYFRRHANWRIPIKGWLSQLDRRRFRLFGYYTGAVADAETERARALCERFVQGPMPIEGWREEIAADAPHVLIYPEIGMEPGAAKLAAQRLAAVQCTSWGHPDTSGLPTIDYFLSSELMEPPDAQQHYCEGLVRLPNLSVYCDPVDKPSLSLPRHELGMRASACVYWCGQSLFKYLPQLDEVFPRIAREVGDCQFAFVEYPSSARVTALFRQRLERAFASFGLRAEDHCLVLPRLEQDRYLAATGHSDVFLDSIGWSGCNSTLEALAYDLPIVTLRGDLMRGRHSAAMLEMMGMTATIAESVDTYVAIAARLGRDPTWRVEVAGKISALKPAIFRDRTCIAALEDFLDRVSRGGPATIPAPRD